MTKYLWNGESWVPWHKPPPRPRLAPAIHRDQMEPLTHPCTGETIDSKSLFRRVTRENGCVELGNDAPVDNPRYTPDSKQLRQDIAAAYEQLEQGRPAPAAEHDEGSRIYE